MDGSRALDDDEEVSKDTQNRVTYSAFILSDDQTWRQPSFSVPVGARESDIESALLAKYGGFCVFGLYPDDSAPEEYVEPLDTVSVPRTTKKEQQR